MEGVTEIMTPIGYGETPPPPRPDPYSQNGKCRREGGNETRPPLTSM